MSIFTNPASSSAEQAREYVSAILELLGTRPPLEVLASTPAAVRERVANLSSRELTTPETLGKWSIAQILQHLADSDLVWGYRLRMVLSHDRPPLMGYDQDLWAERLGYERADADRALADFEALRGMNLRLLARIAPVELDRVGIHAERGEESVAHMLRLYAGHDLLHLRQLERVRSAVSGG